MERGPRDDHQKGSRLDMEKAPTPTEKTHTKCFSGFRSDNERVKTEKSYRKVKITQMAIPTIYSSQEGVRQGTTNLGSVNPQQLHQPPIIQNVDAKRSEAPPSSRLLDYSSGSA